MNEGLGMLNDNNKEWITKNKNYLTNGEINAYDWIVNYKDKVSTKNKTIIEGIVSKNKPFKSWPDVLRTKNEIDPYCK